jgi:DNA repair ATPase RecN
MYKKDVLKSAIIEVMVMNLGEKGSLEYLYRKGFKISKQYYHKLKKQIKESRFDRLNLIAKTEFVDQHLERIDTLNLIQHEMWVQYHNEKEPFKKVQILEKIAELQTYLTAFYDASRYVMEKSIQQKEQDHFRILDGIRKIESG